MEFAGIDDKGLFFKELAEEVRQAAQEAFSMIGICGRFRARRLIWAIRRGILNGRLPR